MDDFVKKNNIELYNYFPSRYFESSHAPLINIYQNNIVIGKSEI